MTQSDFTRLARLCSLAFWSTVALALLHVPLFVSYALAGEWLQAAMGLGGCAALTCAAARLSRKFHNARRRLRL